MTTNAKLSPHTTWLFALGSIATGIGASFVLSGLGQKATAAIYFAIVALGGFASTYLTSARVRGAVLAFVAAAAVAGISYFLLVDSLFHSATTLAASASDAPAQAERAGAAMGKTFGIFVGAIVFLETIIAGIGGAIAGSKARVKGGLAAFGAAARAAR